MRINSTVPCKLPRVTPKEGMVFDGAFVPSGVVVGVAPYMMHMDEGIFPGPRDFSYQRWHNLTADMNRNWMPFGKGARACMGRHLALMQLYIAISTIVRSGVLDNASTVKSAVHFWEWYNVKVVGGKIEVIWTAKEKKN